MSFVTRSLIPLAAAGLLLGACAGDQPQSREPDVPSAVGDSGVINDAEPPDGEMETPGDGPAAVGDGEPAAKAPDLVVTAITWQPKSPQANDAVTFSATIKNAGGSATPQGTILGVRFSIDGTVVAWSDSEKSALVAGDSVTVAANGGPAGSTWKATKGTVSVEALVDDVDRIKEADETNNALAVSLTVGGGSPPTGVCAGAPPAQAAAEGLTHLAFCDDFSTNSIAAGPTPADRDITGNKKWTTELGFGNNSNVMTAASLKWNGDGTVTINPDWEKYQWYMTSVALRSGKMHGYLIDRKKRWYAEIRWRFDKKGGGQPAFWSMDTCHVYKWPGKCTQHGGRYVEPDFWEYFNAVTSTHYYQQGPNGEQIKLTRCNKTVAGAGVSPGEWFTVGHMYTSGPAMQRYYKNEKLIYTRTTSTGGCVDFGGGSTADFIVEMADGRYPIYIGSKYGDVITYDYVRVWEHPNDQKP